MDLIYLSIIRKVIFGILVGFSFFHIFLFMRPITELITKRKYEEDFYYWSVIAGSIIFGFFAFLIV